MQSSEGDVRQRKPKGSSSEKPTGAPKPNLSNEKKSSSGALWVLIILAVISSLAAWFYMRPSLIDPVSYSVLPPPKLEGALAVNDILQKYGKRIYLSKIKGPESVEPCAGALYTGTRDSKILKLSGDTITVVANPGGAKCARLDAGESYPDCGVPGGIRCLGDRELLVADMRLGLYKVDLATGALLPLLSSNDTIDGKPLVNLNHPAPLPDGRFLVSQLYPRNDFRYLAYMGLENKPIGRIISYDPSKGSGVKAAKVELDGLYMPNGLQLTHDKQAILFAESSVYRISKYHIDGPKKGQVEVWSENLPGMPDNIYPSSDGGYWLAVAFPRYEGLGPFGFDVMGYLSTRPWLRRALVKFLPGMALEAFTYHHPASYVLKLDASGRVEMSLHDPSHYTVGGMVSQVTEHKNSLYLGTFLLNYLVQVDLNAAAADIAALNRATRT